LLAVNHQWIAAEIVYIFSHGLNCNDKQAKKYRTIITQSSNLTWLINDPYISFNYPDANSLGFFSSKTSLAQNNEIETLTRIYKQARKKSDEIVLLGMSRGAATILAFAGSKNPSKLRALVVESPFDSIKNVLNQKLLDQKISWIPEYIINTAPGIIFNKYNHANQGPIDHVVHIKKDLPILLVASLEDEIVPAKSTADLYIKLIESGHDHVYFLLLNKGGHGSLISGPESERYLAITHAFYRQHNLPHDNAYAQKGSSLLWQCQPTSSVIKEALEQRKSFIALNNPSN
jgi:predicted esterase